MFCLPLQSYWYFLAMLQYQCSTLPERTSGKGANHHGQQKGHPRLWIWDLRKRQSQTLLLCTQGLFIHCNRLPKLRVQNSFYLKLYIIEMIIVDVYTLILKKNNRKRKQRAILWHKKLEKWFGTLSLFFPVTSFTQTSEKTALKNDTVTKIWYRL